MLTGAYVSLALSLGNRSKILKTRMIRNLMMIFLMVNGGKRFQSKSFLADPFIRMVDSDRTRFGKENFPNILKLVKGLQDLGEKKDATAGQVTLAWLLAQGDEIIPIPGTKKIKVC